MQRTFIEKPDGHPTAHPLPQGEAGGGAHSPALKEEMEEVSIPPALKEEMTEEGGDEIVMRGLPFSPSLEEEMRWHPFPPSHGPFRFPSKSFIILEISFKCP